MYLKYSSMYICTLGHTELAPSDVSVSCHLSAIAKLKSVKTFSRMFRIKSCPAEKTARTFLLGQHRAAFYLRSPLPSVIRRESRMLLCIRHQSVQWGEKGPSSHSLLTDQGIFVLVKIGRLLAGCDIPCCS